MREVALSVQLPDSWTTRLAQKFSAAVRVIDCRPSRDGGIQQLVEISAQPETLEQIVESIRGDENVRDTHVVKTKRGRILGVVATNDSTMCRIIADVNCFCLTCPLATPRKSDGAVDWVLALTAHNSLRKLIRELKAHGITPEIVRVTNISDGEKLTPRQRNIIESAFASGFYEYPRRTGLQNLSKKLGVSSSTLGEMMRRAERKIIASYLHQAPHIGETDT
jgi:predicted DNA binding protein